MAFDSYPYPPLSGQVIPSDPTSILGDRGLPDEVRLVAEGGRQGSSMSADSVGVAREALTEAISDLPSYAVPAALAFLRVLESCEVQRAGQAPRRVGRRRVPRRRLSRKEQRPDLRLIS